MSKEWDASKILKANTEVFSVPAIDKKKKKKKTGRGNTYRKQLNRASRSLRFF